MPRRTPLDGRRQIENEILLRRLSPRLLHCNAEIQHKINIAVRELLGRELIGDRILHSGLFDQAADQSGSLHRHLFELLPRFSEHDPSMQIGCRNIRMEHGGAHPFQRFDRPPDQRFTHLGQHTDPDIRRNMVPLDQRPGKLEIILRCGWKRHFDLFESDLGQQLEILQFPGGIHRHRQCLVPVPQIDGAPYGSACQLPFDPVPFLQGNPGRTLILWNHCNHLVCFVFSFSHRII